VVHAGLWLVAAIVVVPTVVYTLTWLPWAANAEHTDTGAAICAEADRHATSMCLSGPADRARALVQHHRRVLDFHGGFTSEHRYQSPPTAWLLQTRPVTYRWDRCSHDGVDRDGDACAPTGRATQIISLGNLAVWWTGLAALPLLAAGAVRRELSSIVPLSLVLGQFLPWLAVGRPGFSYYAVPIVPFLAAGIAVATLDLARRRRRLAVIVGGTVALGAVVLFVYFAPLWLGIRSDLDAVRARWWLSSWV
jgi:dolichyl-phosphate-mannose--protein O-mannosyl transferase